MTRYFSLVITWGCRLLMVALPVTSIYLLLDQPAFTRMVASTTGLRVRWETVEPVQLYALWLLVTIYYALSVFGLNFLSRAFSSFARGDRFNTANSRNLRLFSILLFIQALVTPLLFAISSVVLSLNHPAGEHMLAVRMGSPEITRAVLAMIFWTTSELLLEGSRLEEENRLFV